MGVLKGAVRCEPRAAAERGGGTGPSPVLASRHGAEKPALDAAPRREEAPRQRGRRGSATAGTARVLRGSGETTGRRALKHHLLPNANEHPPGKVTAAGRGSVKQSDQQQRSENSSVTWESNTNKNKP